LTCDQFQNENEENYLVDEGVQFSVLEESFKEVVFAYD